MKKQSIGSTAAVLAAITLLTACNGAGGSSSAPSSAANSILDSSSVYSSGDFSASDRLISNTGTGGTKEVDNNASEVNTEEVSNNTSVDTSEKGNDNNQTMTPTETEDIKVDTTKIEAGDFTAGGYASTTPDARYKDNGILTWDIVNGLLFDTTQTQDLYNFVKSGYTSVRSVDARIQSRKGGENNPRIAWFESYKKGVDSALITNQNDGWAGNTITVTYENIQCSKELANLLKEPVWADNDGDGTFTDTTENWDKLLEYNEKNDVNKELCVSEENTSITYNYRNYCGDVICLGIRGPNIGERSAYCNMDDTEKEKNIAGIDYTLTCEEDPDAFKLISGDELKNYYSFETKWGISYNEGNTQTLVDNGTLDFRQPVTNCSDYSRAGVTKTGVLGAGAQYYTGMKPGIYHCTITLKDGKQIPIVIENLPIHYENLLWGCRTQAEMDVCVKFAQNGSQGVYGQYIGGTCIRANNSRGKGKENEELLTTDEKDYTLFIKDFNSSNDGKGFQTYEGDYVKLKNTEQAANWWKHYTNINAEYYVLGKPGMSGTYRALDAMTRKGGDCETYSAFMSCMLNVTGYTTRYITGGNHAWLEVKVPGEITQSGEDQWLVVDNGDLLSCITSNAKKVMKKSTIYNEVKGWDTYWNADMPR